MPGSLAGTTGAGESAGRRARPAGRGPGGGGGGNEARVPGWGKEERVTRRAPGDETRIFPPLDPDATAVSPGQGEPNDPTQRWAARAGVPPAGARRPVQQEWVPVEETRGGAWWMPVLISIIVLILLALLGLGLWLAPPGHKRPPPPPPRPPPPAAR